MINTIDMEDKEDNNKVIDNDNDDVVNKINKKIDEDDNDNSIEHKDSESVDVDDTSDIERELNADDLMLTTIDNPYNPKTQYDLWKQWDKDNGYETEEYIARLLNMEESYDVDDEFMLNMLTNKVINDILENDDLSLYRLI